MLRTLPKVCYEGQPDLHTARRTIHEYLIIPASGTQLYNAVLNCNVNNIQIYSRTYKYTLLLFNI